MLRSPADCFRSTLYRQWGYLQTQFDPSLKRTGVAGDPEQPISIPSRDGHYGTAPQPVRRNKARLRLQMATTPVLNRGAVGPFASAAKRAISGKCAAPARFFPSSSLTRLTGRDHPIRPARPSRTSVGRRRRRGSVSVRACPAPALPVFPLLLSLAAKPPADSAPLRVRSAPPPPRCSSARIPDLRRGQALPARAVW